MGAYSTWDISSSYPVGTAECLDACRPPRTWRVTPSELSLKSPCLESLAKS